MLFFNSDCYATRAEKESSAEGDDDDDDDDNDENVGAESESESEDEDVWSDFAADPTAQAGTVHIHSFARVCGICA